MGRKSSIIWNIPSTELQNLLNNSSSYITILDKLGYPKYGGSHKRLKERIRRDGLDLTRFDKNKNVYRKQLNINRRKISDEDFFTISDKRQTCEIKKRILRHSLIEYRCTECGNIGEHNGKVLVLQLDHINGNSTDHRIENLRFLCPNCHSQTATFSGKHKNKKTIIYESLEEKNKRIISRRKFNPSKDELIEQIETRRFIKKVAEHYGVSDTAVRRRCILYNIDYKSIQRNSARNLKNNETLPQSERSE